ncbi:MAG: flavodoxin family protein [Firmicutes bacterium]|nr:flavodoxin family protein [Bacillota bacterium]
MKVLVTYISWTGNTRKIAEAIFQEIQAEKEMKDFGEVKSLDGHDLVFVGFPIHGFGQPSDEAKEFLDKYCASKKTALFVTYSAPEDSPFVPPWLEACKEIAKGTQLIGLRDFQGQIPLEQVDVMLQSTGPKALEIARMVVHSSIGQPDASRLERARAFTREIMEKAKI